MHLSGLCQRQNAVSRHLCCRENIRCKCKIQKLQGFLLLYTAQVRHYGGEATLRMGNPIKQTGGGQEDPHTYSFGGLYRQGGQMNSRS